MKHTHLAVALLASSCLSPTGALAHGLDAAQPSPGVPLTIDAHQNEDTFVPAYLLAAVCGARGEPGEPAFERRLQLARLSEAAQTHANESPPLLANLGGRSYGSTTTSDTARRYFDQGLALTYAFNHPEALRAFRYGRRLDPGCAMSFCGEAYVLGPNINAVEASETPERAEPYADRLAALMPGAGHIVHMPSHIYFRIGRFRDSIQTNRDAVAADESYLAAVPSPEEIYPILSRRIGITRSGSPWALHFCSKADRTRRSKCSVMRWSNSRTMPGHCSA